MSRSALYSPKQQRGMGLLGSVVLAAGVVVAGFLMATAVKEFRKYDQFIEVREQVAQRAGFLAAGLLWTDRIVDGASR